jgi:hypothetical protein
MQLQLTLETNTKQCRKCRETLPLTEFHKNRGAKDGLFHWCKTCAKAHSKRRWEEYPEVREAHRATVRRYRDRVSGIEEPFVPNTVYRLPDEYRRTQSPTHKRRTLETALFLRAVKTRVGCQICGITDADLLDYHHVDQSTKSFTLSARAARNVANPDRLMAEIKKCACLCSNCHRKHHLGKMDVGHLAPIDDNTILRVLNDLG